MTSPYKADRRLLLAHDIVSEASRVRQEMQELVQSNCDHPVVLQNARGSKHPMRICLKCRMLEEGEYNSFVNNEHWKTPDGTDAVLGNCSTREVMQTDSSDFLILLDPTNDLTDLT